MNMSLPLLNAFALSLNVIVTGENASLSALTSLLGSITLSWISGLCKRSIKKLGIIAQTQPFNLLIEWLLFHCS